MGLINKLKNILFEEEEVEIPIIEKKENKEPIYKEMPKKEETPVKSSFYDDLQPVINEEKSMEEKNIKEDKIVTNTEKVSEREIFKSEKTFNFPAFDEEEFESMSPRQNLRPTNVLEHEKKVEAKRVEYKRPEKKEEKPQTKFKPSPIISPVYGILDKNYTPDDITSREEEIPRKLDVDSVRKKAFGELPKEKEEEIELNEKSLDDQILEEKLEKARTIDELLKDSSDEVITLKDEKDEMIPDEYFEEEDDEEKEIKEEPKNLEEESKKEKDEDDTLESDLFDLIDSMYENREDGE